MVPQVIRVEDMRKFALELSEQPKEGEKVVALLLMSYTIGLFVGEEVRDRPYEGEGRALYSGLFILPVRQELVEIIRLVWQLFGQIIHGVVRSPVRS